MSGKGVQMKASRQCKWRRRKKSYENVSTDREREAKVYVGVQLKPMERSKTTVLLYHRGMRERGKGRNKVVCSQRTLLYRMALV